jgi:hypothetical protein
LPVSQRPDKSGLPSAVRGAGALRFGLPSAECGTPGVGYFNHWADEDALATRMTRMTKIGDVDREALDRLNSRIRTLLPELYQDSFETLQPVPMRSAGLKFAPDGRVAWDEM